MATLTFEDKQKRGLIKKFHTLLGKAGVGAQGKEGILAGYNVESTDDLSMAQLIEACNALDMLINPKLKEQDKYRKRLMASIGGWLRMLGVESNDKKIKAIACRAAKRENFNEIPMEQLRSLYSAFNKKQKDLQNVEVLTREKIDYLSFYN